MSRTRNRIGRLRWPILLLIVLGLVVFLVLALALIASEDVRNAFPSAVSSSATDLIFIGFIGGLLTLAIQLQLDDQEEARRLNEYRLGLLLEVVAAYNQTKAARRALRAAGFLAPSSATFERWQIDQFWTQLTKINRAQLAIEKIGRELEVNPGRLREIETLKTEIDAVDQYLGAIIEDWEVHGARLGRGEGAALDSQKSLVGFVKHRDVEGATFGDGMADRMDRIEKSIRNEMAGVDLPDAAPGR